MSLSRTSIRIAVVLGGLLAAFAIAWAAVAARQLATSDPVAQASSGMYAFGDLVLGVIVFGGLALVPLALGLYWLRSVEKFWDAFAWAALLFATTGILAVAASASIENSTGGWILLLSFARICLMPVSALALLTCAVLAPFNRHRLWLAVAAVTDGAIFSGIIVVKFIFPRLVA